MEKTEKIITKIKKVLELSRNNPSQEEARSAALTAQKLMAEYHISMSEVDKIEDVENIIEKQIDVGVGAKWKYSLANIIAKNFRCKYFMYGKTRVVFYGYAEDAEIASMTFQFLFDFGNKSAMNYYQRQRNEAKRNNTHFNGRGIKNAYLIGYLNGIKESLEKQCTALLIVIPEKVKEKYEERSSSFKSRKYSGLRFRNNNEGDQALSEGKRQGRNIVKSRQIESNM